MTGTKAFSPCFTVATFSCFHMYSPRKTRHKYVSGGWPLLATLSVFILAGAGRVAAAEPTFVTGEPLRQTLADPIGASWSGRTFRDALESISRTTQIAIVLDRRVDPSRSVEWSAPAVAVGRLLDELTALHDCAVVWIGPTAYVTPRQYAAGVAQSLAMRNAEFSKLPEDLRTAVAARRSLIWSDLAEPRAVLESLAAEGKLRWTNPDAVPFDALYHVATPPLSLVERLTLVGAGFGLTYRIDSAARAISMVPIDATATTNAATAKPAIHGKPPASPRAIAPGGTQVYTLTIKEVPLSKLVEVLRAKHGLKIRFDDEALKAAGLTTDRHTAVDVRQASLEALLEQAAAPLGMTAKRDGDTVVIGPRK